MTNKYDEFLDFLSLYAEREYAVDAAEFNSLLDAPVADQMANSACIVNATLTNSRYSPQPKYTFSDQFVKFRDEDDVAIFDFDTGEQLETKASVISVDVVKNTIELNVEDGPVPEKVSIFMDLFGKNTYIKPAINQVKNDLPSFPHIENLLDKNPRLPKVSEKDIAKVRDDLKCERDLARIIVTAKKMDGTYLTIQGPPGTGKTFVGAMIAVELMASGKKENRCRIGVMSQSHAGINNLCREIEKVAAKRKFTFSGCKKSGKKRDLLGENKNIRNESKIDLKDLFAGTIWQFARFEKNTFDYLILDEAGQLSLAAVVAAARCAKNLIIIGDQQQLAQVSKAAHPMGSGVSVMEYLLKDAPVVGEKFGFFLNATRRMNNDITGLISALAYDGQLQSHPTAMSRYLDLIDDVANPLGPCGFFYLPIEHRGCIQESFEEAEVIRELALKLIDHKIPPDEIMVVTPYRSQENVLRSRLPDKITIGTVDRIQGQEKDVVFYSLASSDVDMSQDDAEFLLSLNRLNVALSRARRKSILVCSPAIFQMRADSIPKIRLLNALAFARDYHLKLQKEKSHVLRCS